MPWNSSEGDRVTKGPAANDGGKVRGERGRPAVGLAVANSEIEGASSGLNNDAESAMEIGAFAIDLPQPAIWLCSSNSPSFKPFAGIGCWGH